MATRSKGEPDENSLRIWWGQICKRNEWMKGFQEALKKNPSFSSYIIAWSDEILGEGIELMSFYEKDFDVIFELIAEAFSEYDM